MRSRVCVNLISPVLRPKLRLIDRGLYSFGIEISDKHLLRHYPRTLNGQAAKDRLDAAVSEYRINKILIQLAKPLVGHHQKQTELPHLVQHLRKIKTHEV